MIHKPQTLILAATAIISLSSAHARNWTSADGKKNFSADFISYNEASGEVTAKKGYKTIKFNADILSEDDQSWVRAHTAKIEDDPTLSPPTAKASSESQIIGDQIKQGVLTKLVDKQFVPYSMAAPLPNYYFLYFSSST